MSCAYCRSRRAVNKDHVVPQYLRKRLRRTMDYAAIPIDLLETVPSCFECNVRKGTRKLVPPSWAARIPALKSFIPGAWRVWDGNPMSSAITLVHK